MAEIYDYFLELTMLIIYTYAHAIKKTCSSLGKVLFALRVLRYFTFIMKRPCKIVKIQDTEL